MVRIIFDDGRLIECNHIDRIYVERSEMDKVNIIGNRIQIKEDHWMYELAIKALEEMNENLKRKIPTIEESIKTYDQMAKNFTMEFNEIGETIAQNQKVIDILKNSEENNE